MATKKLQILGSLGNKIYTQNDEPTDAPDGALWVDLDETGSTGASGGISVANNAGAHNAVYRGKCLGDVITEEQFANISAGTFDDLFIGDYWTIGGINFRIAAFDYYYGTGGHDPANGEPLLVHHAVIVPDSVYALFPGVQMNGTASTSGGYLGSVMRQNNLDFAYKLVQGFLGIT